MFGIPGLVRVSSKLKNLQSYTLVLSNLIFNRRHVKLGVLTRRRMNNSKFGVVPYLCHHPFHVAHVVAGEGHLFEVVILAELEHLLVLVLVLAGQLENEFTHGLVLLKNLLRVVREL